MSSSDRIQVVALSTFGVGGAGFVHGYWQGWEEHRYSIRAVVKAHPLMQTRELARVGTLLSAANGDPAIQAEVERALGNFPGPKTRKTNLAWKFARTGGGFGLVLGLWGGIAGVVSAHLFEKRQELAYLSAAGIGGGIPALFGWLMDPRFPRGTVAASAMSSMTLALGTVGVFSAVVSAWLMST